MKILFFTNHLNKKDGYGRYGFDIAKEIRNSGHEVLVLTSMKSDNREIEEYPVLKAPAEYLANPLNSFLSAVKIKKIINRFSPDIIHFIAESYAGILPFLKNKKAKTFITLHGTYSAPHILFDNFFKKRISLRLSEKYYEKLDGIIAVSQYTKNHLLNYYPWLKNKTAVIANGINFDSHKPINLSLKPDNNTKKILFVGVVKPRKGILEAVEACKRYNDYFSDNFIYDIIGKYDCDDNYYQKILEKIKKCGFENKIFFRGKVSDEELEEYYSNADLFLMPSANMNNNFEGFGLVFLEANIKGVPCIGSENSGCGEAIIIGKTGFIADPRNSKEIADKMDLILNKNAICGQDCVNWAMQNGIKGKVKKLIDFYHEFYNESHKNI